MCYLQTPQRRPSEVIVLTCFSMAAMSSDPKEKKVKQY